MTEDIRENRIAYTVESDGLADSSDLDIDPANAPGGGPTLLGVTQVVHGGDCDIKHLVDTDGDGTYEVNVTLTSPSGNGAFVFDPAIELFEADSQILRVTNTSGSSADFSINSHVKSGLSQR